MAVAAYASVLSLLRVVGNIQHPSHLRLFPDPKQIDALRETLCFLQDLLEVHSSTITEDTEFVLRKITRDAEILINSYVVEQLYRELENVQNDVAGFCDIDTTHDMIHLLMQEIAPINEALARTIQYDQEQPPIVLNKNKPQNNEDHSQTSSSGERNKIVGLDDRLNHVLEKLSSNQPNLMVIPILGMGGIGKTTLARSLFDHPYNLNHFEVRIWLTISQDYSVQKVLQGLLEDGVIDDEKDRELGDVSEAELITKLYQKLYGQRYLIVLDDVWSEEAWRDLRRSLPDNGKRSRVMVTTRLYDIANSLDSHKNNTYSMELLDENKSWDLFSEVAFQRGARSLELQEIGRKISKRCGGLPLLLVVFGGLLANSGMTVEYWQTVAEDINSFASTENDEYCLKILSLSYHHLPIHLKACFLYARHFKEDCRILVSELIESLVSEGLVKPMKGKTLEEAARKYLKDLIGRNMLLIHERGYYGSTEICGIHDVLRDLSIKQSNKEQFLQLPKTSSVKGFEISVVCAICKERKTATARIGP